jgi:ERCC4-type nuclease
MRRPAMIVDSNERGVLCDSVLRKAEKAGLSVIRKPLVVGDYLLGEACVEAKSINDLFLSSHSGHLWRQLENMDINYQRFFLVIHGGIDKYVAMAKKTGKKVTYTRTSCTSLHPVMVLGRYGEWHQTISEPTCYWQYPV